MIDYIFIPTLWKADLVRVREPYGSDHRPDCRRSVPINAAWAHSKATTIRSAFHPQQFSFQHSNYKWLAFTARPTESNPSLQREGCRPTTDRQGRPVPEVAPLYRASEGHVKAACRRPEKHTSLSSNLAASPTPWRPALRRPSAGARDHQVRHSRAVRAPGREVRPQLKDPADGGGSIRMTSWPWAAALNRWVPIEVAAVPPSRHRPAPLHIPLR